MVDCMTERVKNNQTYAKYLVFAGGKIIFNEINRRPGQDIKFTDEELEMSESYEKIFSEFRDISGKVPNISENFGDFYTELPNVVSFVDGPELIVSILKTYYDIHVSSMEKYEKLSSTIAEISLNKG